MAWAASLPPDRRQRRRSYEYSENPWHDVGSNARQAQSTFINPGEDSNLPSPSGESGDHDGTWGERDAGIESQRMAMQDFEALRRDLTALSRARSQHDGEPLSLARTVTRQSGRRSTIIRRPTTAETGTEGELEGKEEDEFHLEQFMRDGHFEKRVEDRSAKKLGVVWKNLTVRGSGSTATFVKTLPNAILGTFGPDLYRIITRFVPQLKLRRHAQTRVLLNDFDGIVRDGEMMLVLGRPGSGCSTFLKAISNNRESYAEVSGEVLYGGIAAGKQKKQFRGEVNYNPEDDRHFASLNVWQTLKFALMTKTKKREKEGVPIIINALLKIFGITHTRYTLVGDEYVRGVSGGERKRVSIAETLAGKSTVVCWDNSTRGLDSSTALDYAKSLRVMTDISNRTTFVTLYQAGEGIYELMDKVLVIDAGRCIFAGSSKDAKQYFTDLGYHCPERQTTPDFLTSVTDAHERRFKDGFELSAPKGPEALEKAFKTSQYYQRVLEDIRDYEQSLHRSEFADAKEFEITTREQKSKTVQKKSSYTVSFVRQVYACVLREFWLIWGDSTAFMTKFFLIFASGLIVGSLFYGQSSDTSGAFSRGGTMLFLITFLGWLQLSELMKAVSGRAVVARHHDYAFYRPSAVCVARVITDLPLILLQVILFTIIMYFLTGLDAVASKYFILLLIVYTAVICTTALYRLFASLSPAVDDAVRFSGTALNLLVLYTGYVIPRQQLVGKYIWFGWLYYVNPISYAFEAVITNDMSDRVMECAPSNLVPRGPGIDPAYQGCSLTGSTLNAKTVSGASYLQTTYGLTRAHLWRDFGALVGFTVLYIAITAWAVEVFNFNKEGGAALVFKKSKKSSRALKTKERPSDEESGYDKTPVSSGSSGTRVEMTTMNGTMEEQALQSLAKSDRVFTWKDVEYTVPYRGGERKLLNKVSGYAKPGKMVALLGASGAGKTTLLNTLSQRQRVGVVSGEMLVDGNILGRAFQRGTGFCEQMDLHDDTATIREALEFSAILRQEKEVSREEKIKYVNKIIELLELEDMQDAIISSLGVEQRKRLTIGVELAAKPSLLLFLDEPTSGLDSNSAFSIVRFLKKLSMAGQAIVCTIHQPSSILIQQFDMILALNPGGNTFYFGPVGDNGGDVIRYFADRGVDCPPNKNVAEFILETAAKSSRNKHGKRINWNEEWRSSENQREVLEEIARIQRERGDSAKKEQDRKEEVEFAASMWLQTIVLTRRVFTQYWRDPSYLYGKLFVSAIMGIFNGFTFYMLGDSIQDMQNRMFTCFMILLIPPSIVNTVVPKFYQNMALWTAREFPSRIYGWIPFCTAMVVAEIPIALVSAVVYWLTWYLPTGLPTNASTAGYVFLMTLLYFLFTASWGQWICAFAPSFTIISIFLPLFFVMFTLFNGIVRSYAALPAFWRYTMYYINPSTYWLGGVLAATLHNQSVSCSTAETTRFNAPPGRTCGEYAATFLQEIGGYLANPADTNDCQYCQFRNGDQYLRTLNMSFEQKWRNFGIFLAFCISNWALVYFFIYTVRIRGWTFGFGPAIGALSKLGGKVKNVSKRKKGDGKV